MKNLWTPLVGQVAIETLQFLSGVDLIDITVTVITAQFLELFTGVGKIENMIFNYQKQYLSCHKPFVAYQYQYTYFQNQGHLRKSISIRSNIKDKPTDWCEGMVVVLKTDGRVIICMRLTHLYKRLKREGHLLPSDDQLRLRGRC